MIGSLPARRLLATLALLSGFLSTAPPNTLAQAPAVPETNPGQFFLIEEPIDSEVLERIKASTKQLIARSIAQKTARPDPDLRDSPRPSPAWLQRFRHLIRTGQLHLDRTGRRQADGRLRPPRPQGLRRSARARLRRDRHGSRRLDRTDHARKAIPSRSTTGSRSASSPAARGRSPTCSSACSTATPTSSSSGPPTARSITSWPRTSPTFSRRTRSTKKTSSPPGKGAARASSPPPERREEGFAKLLASDRAEIANVYRIGYEGPLQRPDLAPGAQAGLDRHRRADRPHQGGVSSGAGSSRPAAKGST